MYLLDTNICIFIINRKPAHVLDRLQSVVQKKIFISSVSVAELQYGVHHSRSVEQNLIALTEFLAPFDILDFDSRAAGQYGMLREALVQKGKLIGPYDLLIASQALANDLTLVTNNQKEFRQIKQLKLEDWKK